MRFNFILAILLAFVVISCSEDSLNDELDPSSFTYPEKGPKRFLALGDLYTMGFKIDSIQKWPKQLVDSLRNRGVEIEEPEIIADRYWKAEDLELGIKDYGTARGYDLVTIMIGVNDQWLKSDKKSFRESFINVVTLAMHKTTDDPSKILIFSIPDYGYTPWNYGKRERISPEIEEFNAIILEVANSYNIKYIDIVPLSKLAVSFQDHTLDDGFHYTGKHYTTWVKYLLDNHNFFNQTGN